ncbi:MAG: PqqD family peptide modification chaperone [Desulfatirhabdiaceae bacterium]
MENGEVLILYPEGANPWVSRILSWMGKTEDRVRMRKVQLDVLGSQVWQLIDGDRTVLEIIDVFARSHQLHHREAELSVVQFVRELGRRQIVFLK